MIWALLAACAVNVTLAAMGGDWSEALAWTLTACWAWLWAQAVKEADRLRANLDALR